MLFCGTTLVVNPIQSSHSVSKTIAFERAKLLPVALIPAYLAVVHRDVREDRASLISGAISVFHGLSHSRKR